MQTYKLYTPHFFTYDVKYDPATHTIILHRETVKETFDAVFPVCPSVHPTTYRETMHELLDILTDVTIADDFDADPQFFDDYHAEYGNSRESFIASCEWSQALARFPEFDTPHKRHQLFSFVDAMYSNLMHCIADVRDRPEDYNVTPSTQPTNTHEQ